MATPSKPRGRPRKTGTERSVSISIAAHHNALVEAAVEDAERFAADYSPAPAGSAPRGERRTILAKMKRETVGTLIEKHLSIPGRFPLEVRIAVPVEFVGDEDAIRAEGDEVSAWLRRETERLTAEAPPAIQRAFARSAMERLKRADPAAHRAELDKLRARLLAGDGDDDE